MRKSRSKEKEAATDRLMDGNSGSVGEIVPYELSRRQICEDYCKRFIAFLLSSVGLTFSMIFYTILGGIIFQHLESENEQNVKNNVCDIRRYKFVRMTLLRVRVQCEHITEGLLVFVYILNCHFVRIF